MRRRVIETIDDFVRVSAISEHAALTRSIKRLRGLRPSWQCATAIAEELRSHTKHIPGGALAAATGVRRRTITRFRSGRDPSIGLALRLASLIFQNGHDLRLTIEDVSGAVVPHAGAVLRTVVSIGADSRAVVSHPPPDPCAVVSHPPPDSRAVVSHPPPDPPESHALVSHAPPESRAVVAHGTDSRALVSHGTDSRAVVSHGTDSRAVVAHGTDSRALVSHGTDSRAVVSHGTESRAVVSHDIESREAVSHGTESRAVVSHDIESCETAPHGAALHRVPSATPRALPIQGASTPREDSPNLDAENPLTSGIEVLSPNGVMAGLQVEWRRRDGTVVNSTTHRTIEAARKAIHDGRRNNFFPDTQVFLNGSPQPETQEDLAAGLNDLRAQVAAMVDGDLSDRGRRRRDRRMIEDLREQLRAAEPPSLLRLVALDLLQKFGEGGKNDGE